MYARTLPLCAQQVFKQTVEERESVTNSVKRECAWITVKPPPTQVYLEARDHCHIRQLFVSADMVYLRPFQLSETSSQSELWLGSSCKSPLRSARFPVSTSHLVYTLRGLVFPSDLVWWDHLQ